MAHPIEASARELAHVAEPIEWWWGAKHRTHRILRRGLHTVAGALIALCVFATSGVPAHADDVAFKFTDSRLTECSGMATDTERAMYWAINDSEATRGGRIYGVKPNGDTTTSIHFGASIVDTEALAYVNGSFYVGDIGDNDAARANISVYRLNSPRLGASDATYTRYRFRYPDGPRDAEGMWVTSSGRIYIVSKEASGGIYVAPEKLSTSAINVLKKVGTAPSFATDATLLRDGRIAVRTYTAVSILDPASYKVVASAQVDLQPQGEAITQTLDGSALLLGSEGKYSQVLRTPIPKSVGNSPSPSATPSASSPATRPPTATTGPSSTAAPDDGASLSLVDAVFEGQNTLWIAVGVAIVAAFVVFIRRR